MKKPVFTGSSAAIITPFSDGHIDYAAMKRLIDLQRNAGTAAITVCGTTGEASALSSQERQELIYFTKQNAGPMTVIAGSGSNSTEYAVRFSLDAQSAGADAVLVVTPYYNKTSQEGLVEHYYAVADAVDLPVILYNVPSRTGMTITPETYRRLAGHPNINGVKEASGSVPLAVAVLRDTDLNLWSGNDDLTVPLMCLGAKGVISVAANVIPAQMAKLAGLCLSGRYREAAEEQLRLSPLMEALFLDVNPIPVKAAAEILGLCSGQLRLPLRQLSEEKKKKLSDVLRAYA